MKMKKKTQSYRRKNKDISWNFFPSIVHFLAILLAFSEVIHMVDFSDIWKKIAQGPSRTALFSVDTWLTKNTTNDISNCFD